MLLSPALWQRGSQALAAVRVVGIVFAAARARGLEFRHGNPENRKVPHYGINGTRLIEPGYHEE